MKHLQTIQKTFNVFKILSKIGMIVSFIAAGFALVGLLCGIAWYSGGRVMGFSGETLFSMTVTPDLNQMICVLLSDMIFALTDGILLLLTFQYFKAEQQDGTPFTYSGADRIQKLGILTMVLFLVAAILSAVVYECFHLEPAGDVSNLDSIALGIVMILASLVFRYGADLEAKLGEKHV